MLPLHEYLDRQRTDLYHLKVEVYMIGNPDVESLVDKIDYHIRRIEKTLNEITEKMEV